MFCSWRGIASGRRPSSKARAASSSLPRSHTQRSAQSHRAPRSVLHLHFSRAFVSKMPPKLVVSLLYAISIYEKCWLKNVVSIWKLRVMLVRWEFLGLPVQEAAFQVALRELLFKRLGEESGYIGLCNKAGRFSGHQRLVLIKEKQISQAQEFSTLLCLERCKHLGSLKPFLSYTSLLSEAESAPWLLTFLIPCSR